MENNTLGESWAWPGVERGGFGNTLPKEFVKERHLVGAISLNLIYRWRDQYVVGLSDGGSDHENVEYRSYPTWEAAVDASLDNCPRWARASRDEIIAAGPGVSYSLTGGSLARPGKGTGLPDLETTVRKGGR